MQEVEQTSVTARVRRVRCLGIGMLMWKRGDGGKGWRFLSRRRLEINHYYLGAAIISPFTERRFHG